METVVGRLFNAVAFAGAGFLFSKLNHTGYEKEIKRHNLALEKWYENQVRRKEKLERLRQQLSDANVDINRTNKSLKNLQNEYQREEENEPQLKNYYTPSKEMQEYQNVAVLLIGITGGYLADKFILH